MTRLSVNINKIATLRNSRGGNIPNVVEAAIRSEEFGAEGITVHPRPDERHIRYQDVYDLRKVVQTEFNIEGYPSRKFLDLIKSVQPEQVTLVPDKHNAITSNEGWDTINNLHLLQDIVSEIKTKPIRVSIFIGTDPDKIAHAVQTGTDRIELYTEPYASAYPCDKKKAAEPFIDAANKAKELGLGINAGHDLSLENLSYLSQHIPFMDEVSIGHALIADALYYGLENTIQLYKRQLNR